MDGYIRTETDIRGNTQVGPMMFKGRSGLLQPDDRNGDQRHQLMETS
jgi:hypothetical protein